MIEPKKLFWVFVAIIIIITAFTEYNRSQAEKTLEDAKAIKEILDKQYEVQQENCYLRVADGSCIALSEIGIIEKTDVDTLCVQLNCTNQTEYSRGIVSLIVFNNLIDKKIIFLH